MKFQCVFSQSNKKELADSNDNMVITEKSKRKKSNKSNTSKEKANDGTSEHAKLPGRAIDKADDVKSNNRLLVHPIGRWFEEVIYAVSSCLMYSPCIIFRIRQCI